MPALAHPPQRKEMCDVNSVEGEHHSGLLSALTEEVVMTNNDTRFGPQDTPPRDRAGTSADRQVDHGPDHPSGQQGLGHGGHAGHGWMMMICCVPMLVIAIALVASGTAGVGTVVVALGCTLMMALMMRGMGGHGGGGGGK